MTNVSNGVNELLWALGVIFTIFLVLIGWIRWLLNTKADKSEVKSEVRAMSDSLSAVRAILERQHTEARADKQEVILKIEKASETTSSQMNRLEDKLEGRMKELAGRLTLRSPTTGGT